MSRAKVRRLPVLKASPFDCRTCGACCATPVDQDSWADLTKNDLKRLTLAFRKHAVIVPRQVSQWAHHGDYAALKTVWRKQSQRGVYPRKKLLVCVALRGSVGHRVSCSIYGRRPKVCIEFKPGSRYCLELRRDHGVDVELSA